METTPDKYCTWQVHADYLTDTLNEIHKNESTVISVVPHELVLTPAEKYRVITYIVIYCNPALVAIPGGIGNSGASMRQ